MFISSSDADKRPPRTLMDIDRESVLSSWVEVSAMGDGVIMIFVPGAIVNLTPSGITRSRSRINGPSSASHRVLTVRIPPALCSAPQIKTSESNKMIFFMRPV